MDQRPGLRLECIGIFIGRPDIRAVHPQHLLVTRDGGSLHEIVQPALAALADGEPVGATHGVDRFQVGCDSFRDPARLSGDEMPRQAVGQLVIQDHVDAVPGLGRRHDAPAECVGLDQAADAGSRQVDEVALMSEMDHAHPAGGRRAAGPHHHQHQETPALEPLDQRRGRLGRGIGEEDEMLRPQLLPSTGRNRSWA
jgi:hypothetical protein